MLGVVMGLAFGMGCVNYVSTPPAGSSVCQSDECKIIYLINIVIITKTVNLLIITKLLNILIISNLVNIVIISKRVRIVTY